jgi:MerR family transcriptional regulator/heat shock protein HspR
LPGTVPGAATAEQPSERPGPSEKEATWDDVPAYVISVAAQMVGMHAQTLRYYERAGLVTPARSKGNIRLYRRSDIERLRLIQRLIADHGVNLAGVELVLQMEGRIRQLQDRLDALSDGKRSAGSAGRAPGVEES